MDEAVIFTEAHPFEIDKQRRRRLPPATDSPSTSHKTPTILQFRIWLGRSLNRKSPDSGGIAGFLRESRSVCVQVGDPLPLIRLTVSVTEYRLTKVTTPSRIPAWALARRE